MLERDTKVCSVQVPALPGEIDGRFVPLAVEITNQLADFFNPGYFVLDRFDLCGSRYCWLNFCLWLEVSVNHWILTAVTINLPVQIY